MTGPVLVLPGSCCVWDGVASGFVLPLVITTINAMISIEATTPPPMIRGLTEDIAEFLWTRFLFLGLGSPKLMSFPQCTTTNSSLPYIIEQLSTFHSSLVLIRTLLLQSIV